MRQLSRDPFARNTNYVQIVKHVGHHCCKWCGNKGKELPNLKSNFKFSLKRYYSEPDSIGRKFDHADKPLFCCKSCFNSYNN